MRLVRWRIEAELNRADDAAVRLAASNTVSPAATEAATL
jgi:hypothetical protein